MLNIDEGPRKGGGIINKIIIPQIYMPTTGYGEIRLIIVDGKVVDCKTTTSHRVIEEIKNKRE